MQINFSFGSLTLFNWKPSKSQLTNQTKKQPPRPAQIDYTEYPVANEELTKGLYHNSVRGLKLAGSMAYAPIAIPVAFMGLPVPVPEDENYQEDVSNLLKQFSSEMKSIHTQSHREGTIWIWPFFDAKELKVRWDFIPDESVVDIILDINTKEIKKLIVFEQITISIAENEIGTATRKREFTKQKITETWAGQTIPGAKNKIYRNPIGVLPIPFANNVDGKGHRGYSDYERIIADMKDYHDIDARTSSMLARFTIKMIQSFSTTPGEWLSNNGYDDISDIDIASTDFILNKLDEEKTEYVYPEGAYAASENALKRKFKKIVEGSALPELLWGVKTEGNHSSAEEQMNTFVLCLKGKQTQHNNAYQQLWDSTFALLYLAGQIPGKPDFEIKWNDLSGLSEKTKAEIFNLFASGISSLINVAGFTKDMLHKLWLKLYPGETVKEFEEFIQGLSDMASHKQFKDTDYGEAIGLVEGDL